MDWGQATSPESIINNLLASITFKTIELTANWLAAKAQGTPNEQASKRIWKTAITSLTQTILATEDKAKYQNDICRVIREFLTFEGVQEELIRLGFLSQQTNIENLRVNYETKLQPEDRSFLEEFNLDAETIISALLTGLTQGIQQEAIKEAQSSQTPVFDQLLLTNVQETRRLVEQQIPSGEPPGLPAYIPPPLLDPSTLPEPGALPHGSRVIFPRNALFTGRVADLLALAEATFYAAPGPVAITQTISGIGGVGKTQLAVEFAYRYGRFTQGVHWINAASDFNTEVAACGQAMCLQPWPDKTPEQVAFTLAAWQRKPDRLVILDNLENPDLLQDWLPQLTGLHILITSRRTDIPSFLDVHGLALKSFTRAESLAFLGRLTPRLKDNATLDSLAERLGDLPLALHLAGSALAIRKSLSPEAYLVELEQAGGALKHKPLPPSLAASPTDHNINLFATFQISWELLNPAEPSTALARRVFLACGYCAPNTPIPHDLLAALAEENIDLALHRLVGLGLVEQLGEGVSVHPLLAEFGRGEAAGSEGAKGEYTGSPLTALVDALIEIASSANESGLPARGAPYQAHLIVAAQHMQAVEPARVAMLLNNLGYYLNMSGNLAAARPHYEQALAINRETMGKRHPDTATSLNNLGLLLQAQGDLPTARSCYEQALAINREVLGEHHPNTANSLNNLGTLLQAQGDLPGARSYYEQVLAINREVLGEHHPKTAISYGNLGQLLLTMGELEAARPNLEKALEIHRELLGETHPYIATGLNNLGLLLQNQGDLPAARQYLEQALTIRRETLGERHPDTATSLNNLGLLLHNQDDLPTARSYYEQALAINRETLGERHPNTATNLNNLGKLLYDLGDLPAARPYLEQALAIRREVLGEHHPDTAASLNNLGKLLYDLGDLPAAIRCVAQALTIYEATLPPDHPYTQEVRFGLSFLDQQLKNTSV